MPEPPSHRSRYTIGGHTFEAEKLAPGLYITATPIGNLGDITLRALATLAAADEILCEDTRVTAKLARRYGLARRLTPYHDHNAAKVRPGLIAKLKAGAALALVSDAGMPLVNDPGYKLVREAIAEGMPVTVVPGASASLAGLALSGLPSDRFFFAGFLPQRLGERRRALQAVKDIQATLIFFESANRIVASLEDIALVLGDRDVAVLRELTKLHEEGIRGTARHVAEILAGRQTIKGEITLVIAPAAEASVKIGEQELDGELLAAARDMSLSQAAQQIAHRHGLPRKDLYARLLALKNETPAA